MFSMLIGKLKSWWSDRSILEKSLFIISNVLLSAFVVCAATAAVFAQKFQRLASDDDDKRSPSPSRQYYSSMQEAFMTNNYSSPLIAEVIDATQGEPADHIRVTVLVMRPSGSGNFTEIAMRRTDVQGRTPGLLAHYPWSKGVYKLVLDTGQYFYEKNPKQHSFSRVELEFAVEDPEQRYFIQAFITPHSYSVHGFV